MLTAGQILRFVSPDQDRVKEIAGRLGLESIGRKSEVGNRIARSLPQRVGKEQAVEKLLDVFTREELLEFFLGDSAPFEGTEGNYLANSRLRGQPKEWLRQLASELARADLDETDELLSKGKYQEFFRYEELPEFDMESFARGDFETDGSPDDDEEADEEEDDEPDLDGWRAETGYDVHPTSVPPAGLTFVDSPLLPHQTEALKKLCHWWEGNEKAGVLCLPTGAGKTRTTVSFGLVAVRPSRILWLTHRHELADQAVKEFVQRGKESRGPFRVARYQARLKDREQADVVVASIPTLVHGASRGFPNLDECLDTHGKFDLVVIDECHHGVARTWTAICTELQKRQPDVRFLGLSATPTRTAEKEKSRFWRQFQKMIHEARALDLIHARVLARPKLHLRSLGTEIDADARERRHFQRFGDLAPSLAREIAENKTRVRFIADEFVRARKTWGQTLIFVFTRQQGRLLSKALRERDVDVEELYGDTPQLERKQIIDAFREGKTQVLVNVLVASEGTDLPSVQTVFLARPTRSAILFSQMVGRGLRGPAVGGKPECNVVTFYESIVGLAEGQLASCFSKESEALAALGLEPEALSTLEAEEAMPEDAEPKDAAEALRAVIAQADACMKSGCAVAADAEVSLVGWWEAGDGDRKMYLPVFADDVHTIDACIGRIVRGRDGGQAAMEVPSLRWGSEEVYLAFRTAVMAFTGMPRFVDLTTAGWESAREMAEAVLEPPSAAAVVSSLPPGATTATPSTPASAGAGSTSLLSMARALLALGNVEVRLNGTEAPPVEQALGELRTLPREEWLEATRALHKVFYRTRYSTAEEMLVEFLHRATVA